MHLLIDDPERESSFSKAKNAFEQGGLINWVETVEKASG
jgi:hypothetical protein